MGATKHLTELIHDISQVKANPAGGRMAKLRFFVESLHQDNPRPRAGEGAQQRGRGRLMRLI